MRRASASTGRKTCAPRTRSRPRSRPSTVAMVSAIWLPTSQPKRRIGLACGATSPGARPPARRPRGRSHCSSTRPWPQVARLQLARRLQPRSQTDRPLRPSQAAKPLSRRPRRWSRPWSRDNFTASRTSPAALRHLLSLGVEAVCTNPAGHDARSSPRKPTARPALERTHMWPSLPIATTSLVEHERRLQQKALCHLARCFCLCPGCLTARVKLRVRKSPDRERPDRRIVNTEIGAS